MRYQVKGVHVPENWSRQPRYFESEIIVMFLLLCKSISSVKLFLVPTFLNRVYLRTFDTLEVKL